MRKYLLAATALTTTILFMVPGAATAQSTSYDWSGAYVGGSIGVLNAVPGSGVDFTYSGATTLPSHIDLSRLRFSGTIGTGINFQSGSIVYGVEGDITGISDNETGSVDTLVDGYARGTARLDTLLTARARVGVAVDKLLLYGTAGVAAGHASLNTDFGKGSSDTAEGTLLGFTGGLGIEYAATDNVSLKLEGLYYHLGSLTTNGTAKIFATPAITYAGTYNPSGAIIRAGLNLHF
jgi:outer membrane immunogenic protein